MINYTDFAAVDIRSGTIVKAEVFSRAEKPAYKVWVDFGDTLGVLTTSAQITKNYSLLEIIGLKVMGCVNLGEKNIAGFLSQFLLLGFEDENGYISLPVLCDNIPNGKKLC